jgi:hypothetical protein
MLASLQSSGSDAAVGAYCRLIGDDIQPPSPAMQRAHGEQLRGVRAAEHPAILANTGLSGRLLRRSYLEELLAGRSVSDDELAAAIYCSATLDVLAEVTALRRIDPVADQLASLAALRHYESAPELLRARLTQVLTDDLPAVIDSVAPGDPAWLAQITAATEPLLPAFTPEVAAGVSVRTRTQFVLAATGQWAAYFGIVGFLAQADALAEQMEFMDRVLMGAGVVGALDPQLPSWLLEPQLVEVCA